MRPLPAHASAHLTNIKWSCKKIGRGVRQHSTRPHQARGDCPMNAVNLPSAEFLRKILRYEPETGMLFWKERTPEMFATMGKRSNVALCASWNARHAGKQALNTTHKDGYSRGQVLNKSIFAHRAAWALSYGRWPENEIDHVDGNPSNNKIENLREATRLQNSYNRSAQKNNKHGSKGVFWSKHKQRWHARIGHNGKKIHIGYFKAQDDAIAAYTLKAQELHGEFWRGA